MEDKQLSMPQLIVFVIEVDLVVCTTRLIAGQWLEALMKGDGNSGYDLLEWNCSGVLCRWSGKEVVMNVEWTG